MTKKEYLLKVLEKIQEVSPFARGLKLLIERGNLDNEVIDAIQTLVDKKIKEERMDAEHNALQKTSQVIKKMKSTEKDLKQSEMEEMDSILEDIK